MRPVWLEGSRAGSLEDLGESRVTVSGTMKVLNKFHFLSSLPLHLVMACSGLCVWGLRWGWTRLPARGCTGLCQEKGGGENPKPQKVGTKEQSKGQASARQPSRDDTLAQRPEHPILEWRMPPSTLAPSQAFRSFSHSSEMDRSATAMVSLSICPPPRIIHLFNKNL